MVITKGMEDSATYLELMQHSMRTREDVVASLDSKILKYVSKATEDRKTPAAFYTMIDAILHAFRDRIQDAVLFDELPDWWIYNYDLEYDKFSFYMEHVKEIDVDENSEHYKGYTIDAQYPLVSLSFKTVSSGEYAELYSVGEGTVRQWIRRGKLRTATKIGNEWRIPVLTVPPGRGYEGAQYIWHDEMDDLPEEYSYLNEYRLATFAQDLKEKDKFHVILVSKKTFNCDDRSNNKEIVMDANEREKLELVMIARPEIRYCMRY